MYVFNLILDFSFLFSCQKIILAKSGKKNTKHYWPKSGEETLNQGQQTIVILYAINPISRTEHLFDLTRQFKQKLPIKHGVR